jgi:hypothetical protein
MASQTSLGSGRLVLVLIVLCIVSIIGSRSVSVQESIPAKQLSEIQKLKAENFKLRVELAKAKALIADRDNKILSLELSNEQQKLLEEFKQALEPKDGTIFDWDKLAYAPSPTARKRPD